MKKNIAPTHTSDARNVRGSRLSHSSIGRIPQRRGGGHGIAIASNVGALRALITPPRTKISGTPGCEHGARRIRSRLAAPIGASAWPNTALPRNKSHRCVMPKADAARYVSVPHRGSSLITAISKVTSDRFSARHATRFSAGTNGRPKRSCVFNDISRRTLSASQPCHADVLLELANAGGGDANKD